MNIDIVNGDLLKQDVEVIVNPWNQNIFPWWLLIPQGVSKKVRKEGGTQPFKELYKKGFISLGSAILTQSGNLPFKGIIHVAGINLFWFATKNSIQKSVINSIKIANKNHFNSIAFPLIGAGTGGMDNEKVLNIIKEALHSTTYKGKVLIVIYK